MGEQSVLAGGSQTVRRVRRLAVGGESGAGPEKRAEAT